MFIFIVSSNPSVQTEPRTKSLLQLSSSAHRPPLLSSFHLFLNSAILWSLTEIPPFSPDTRAATAAVVSQPKTVSHTHKKAAFPSFGFPSAEGFICSVYLYKIKFVFIVVALKTLNMFLKKSLEKLCIHANTRKSWLTILELLLLTTTLQRNRVCPSSGTFFLKGGDVSAEVPLFHPISVRMSITETANLQSRLQFPHVKVTCFINQLCSTALLHSYN